MSGKASRVSETQSVSESGEESPNEPVVAGAVSVPKRVVGEIVPNDAPEVALLAQVRSQLGMSASTVIDNFPNDALTRWKLDNTATTGGTIPLVEAIGQVIQPKYWRIEPVELENERNGELTTVPRVVLWTHDDKVYHATSFGVFAVVATFTRAFGLKELPNGVKMRVAEIQTRSRRKMLTLQAV